MKFIQLIIQNLIFLKFNWLKITQNLKHEVAIVSIFPGVPRVRDYDGALDFYSLLFFEVERRVISFKKLIIEKLFEQFIFNIF